MRRRGVAQSDIVLRIDTEWSFPAPVPAHAVATAATPATGSTAGAAIVASAPGPAPVPAALPVVPSAAATPAGVAAAQTMAVVMAGAGAADLVTLMGAETTKESEFVALVTCRGSYNRFEPLQLFVHCQFVSAEPGSFGERSWVAARQHPFVHQRRSLRPPFDVDSGNVGGRLMVSDCDRLAGKLVSRDADAICSMRIIQVQASLRSGLSWWLDNRGDGGNCPSWNVTRVDAKPEKVPMDMDGDTSEDDWGALLGLGGAAAAKEAKAKAAPKQKRHSKLERELVQILEEIMGDGTGKAEAEDPNHLPTPESSSASESGSEPESSSETESDTGPGPGPGPGGDSDSAEETRAEPLPKATAKAGAKAKAAKAKAKARCWVFIMCYFSFT